MAFWGAKGGIELDKIKNQDMWKKLVNGELDEFVHLPIHHAIKTYSNGHRRGWTPPTYFQRVSFIK